MNENHELKGAKDKMNLTKFKGEDNSNEEWVDKIKMYFHLNQEGKGLLFHSSS